MNQSDPITEYQEKKAEARRKISELALNLHLIFTPMDIVGLLVGAAMGVLTESEGPEKAKQYLTILAEEYDKDQDVEWRGKIPEA